jgi:hypothetical protein
MPPTKKEQAAEIEKLARLQAELDELRRQGNRVTEDAIALKEKELEIAQLLKNAGDTLNTSEEARLEILQREKAALEQNNAALEKRRESLKAGEEAGRGFAEGIGLTTVGLAQEASAMVKSGQASNQMAAAFQLVGGRVAGFTKQLAASLTPLALLTRSLAAVGALDEMAAGFTAATGLSRDFAYEAFQLRTQVMGLGISQEKLVEAGNHLIDNFTIFDQLAQEQRGELTLLSAKFSALGIDIVPVLTLAVQNLGMSLEEAEDLTMELAGAADALGKPVNELTKDFEEVTDTVIFFGERGMDVFIDLERQAERTGISVSELDNTFGAMSRFTTFDSAAESVARLNAAIGAMGGEFIDTVDFMRAEPSEKIEMLRAQLESTGQSFTDVSGPMQRVLSDALGIPMTQLAAIMNEVDASLGVNQEALDNYGWTAEEFRERVGTAATAQARLKTSFDNLIVAVTPMVEVMTKLIDWFGRLADKAGQFFTALDDTQQLLTAGGFLASLGILSGALTTLASGMGLGGAAAGIGTALAGGISLLTGLLPALALALGAAALAFVGFGTGMRLAGDGIREMAIGLQTISEIESTENIESILELVKEVPRGTRFGRVGRGFRNMGEGIAMIDTEKAQSAQNLLATALAFSTNTTGAQLAALGPAIEAAIGSGFNNAIRAAGDQTSNINLNIDGNTFYRTVARGVGGLFQPALTGG